MQGGWVISPFGAGLALMSIFAPDAMPQWVSIVGFWIGAGLFIFGLTQVAAVNNAIRSAITKVGWVPIYILVAASLGIIGTSLFFMFLSKPPEVLPRVEIVSFKRYPPQDGNPAYVNVWFHNTGTVTVKGIIHNWQHLLSDRILGAPEEDYWMTLAEPQSEYPGPNETEHWTPGKAWCCYFSIPMEDVTQEDYDAVMRREKYLYIFIVMRYQDLVTDNIYRLEFCQYFFSPDTSTMNCNGHNRIFKEEL